MIRMPWYDKLERKLAPTEGAANLLLLGIIVITLVILLFGSRLAKVGWGIYMVSP